jgi:hypothetical protein
VANLTPYTDASGAVATYATTGSLDESSAFFQALGTNGRSCATCHQVNQGLGLSAASAQALYLSSAGLDPLFSSVDGANCPAVAAGDASGHSLLLNNGLIRIAIALPASPQFTISVVSDPYGCALTSSGGVTTVSVYRRPLPTTNVAFLSQVMWDTRETAAALTNASTFATNLPIDLGDQTTQAALTHFQATAPPGATQVNAMVTFMLSLFSAQSSDTAAGSLSANGALGGAANLASTAYYPGINDAFGGDPQGAKFNPAIFSLYQGWANSPVASRASIASGQQLFNTAPLQITGVRGINDNPALGSPQVVNGSCGTCHDTPNVGNHSLPLAMDTGVGHLAADESDASILAGLAQLSAPALPIYKISGCTDANNHPVTYFTTDPGRGLFTGLCVDVNRTKVPLLRGLAARAPFFHNGSAPDLAAVVKFYNARFQMHLNPQQQADLANFLAAL